VRENQNSAIGRSETGNDEISGAGGRGLDGGIVLRVFGVAVAMCGVDGGRCDVI